MYFPLILRSQHLNSGNTEYETKQLSYVKVRLFRSQPPSTEYAFEYMQQLHLPLPCL